MAVIDVQDLAIGYDGIPVQEHLNFQVDKGEVFLILGGSGCGKSTLLRHLIGLQRPLSGSIHIDGVGDPRSVKGRRPSFGVMFQSGALFGSMTLGQNVALPLERWTDLDPKTIDTIVRWKLRLVGLDGFENHLPSEVSGGMKKRAGIARALSLETDLVFLDEPSAGLDPISAVELDELILTLSQNLGVTMVIVTHELESIFKVGTRCIMLDKEARGMIAEGDPRELRDEPPNFKVRTFFRRLPAGGV